MFVKKKSGSILVETNIFLMIVLCILSASCKVITRNIDKSQYLYSREDIKTISYLEYEFLQEFNKFIKSESENYLKLKTEGDNKKKNIVMYKDKTNNVNYKNYSIIYNGEKFYITHEKNNSTKFIGLDKFEEGEIKFKVNTYKTDYIYGVTL